MKILLKEIKRHRGKKNNFNLMDVNTKFVSVTTEGSILKRF